MLLTGALTVSFAANAVEVKDNENTTRVEVKDNSAEHKIGRASCRERV